MDDQQAKLAALRGMRSGARRARNPNAPDRNELMIAIGLGKPTTTAGEDDAISRLGDPSAHSALRDATPAA
jgi:hypothetical protein